MNTFKKFPPYGREAALNPEIGIDRAIIVCAGSDGFNRARESKIYSWCGSIKHKLVLPFGEHPEVFKWPVAGYIVSVHQFGEPEPLEILERLAACCLSYGAVRVLLIGDEMTRYFAETQARSVSNG